MRLQDIKNEIREVIGRLDENDAPESWAIKARDNGLIDDSVAEVIVNCRGARPLRYRVIWSEVPLAELATYAWNLDAYGEIAFRPLPPGYEPPERSATLSPEEYDAAGNAALLAAGYQFGEAKIDGPYTGLDMDGLLEDRGRPIFTVVSENQFTSKPLRGDAESQTFWRGTIVGMWPDDGLDFDARWDRLLQQPALAEQLQSVRSVWLK